MPQNFLAKLDLNSGNNLFYFTVVFISKQYSKTSLLNGPLSLLWLSVWNIYPDLAEIHKKFGLVYRADFKDYFICNLVNISTIYDIIMISLLAKTLYTQYPKAFAYIPRKFLFTTTAIITFGAVSITARLIRLIAKSFQQ